MFAEGGDCGIGFQPDCPQRMWPLVEQCGLRLHIVFADTEDSL